MMSETRNYRSLFLGAIEEMETAVEADLKRAARLHQSILKKAFEGELLSETEIEKCKQEADYEPAEVLLERMKNEKKK